MPYNPHRPQVVVTFFTPGVDYPTACEVTSATIRHGRDDPDAQPEASALSAEFVVRSSEPAQLELGSRVLLESHWKGNPYQRFYGTLTDLRLGWSDPDTQVGTFVAVGFLAGLGRQVIGDSPWPSELDGARVSRIFGLALDPALTDPAKNDPGRVMVLARDVDAQPALDVAGSAAVAGAGIVWENLNGLVLYADAEHRRNTPVKVELSACDLPLAVEWSKTLDGLCNDVRIRYGLAPPDGQQPEVRSFSQPSIDKRGRFGASMSTVIATSADAQKRADYIVARQSAPAWLFSGTALPLDDRFLTADLMTSLLAVDVHDLVRVTGLPAGSPATSALLWVEGWEETITPESDELTLIVSDYCRSAATPHWNDVDPAVTWDTIGTLTWDQATCLPPPQPMGRWDDTPATLRWDQIDPATTWDGWAQ